MLTLHRGPAIFVKGKDDRGHVVRQTALVYQQIMSSVVRPANTEGVNCLIRLPRSRTLPCVVCLAVRTKY